MGNTEYKNEDQDLDYLGQLDVDEKQPDVAFDEKAMKLMELIKEHIDPSWDAIIVIKPGPEPMVYVQGHPYDVTALGAKFIREMKGRILPNIDC